MYIYIYTHVYSLCYMYACFDFLFKLILGFAKVHQANSTTWARATPWRKRRA